MIIISRNSTKYSRRKEKKETGERNNNKTKLAGRMRAIFNATLLPFYFRRFIDATIYIFEKMRTEERTAVCIRR